MINLGSDPVRSDQQEMVATPTHAAKVAKQKLRTISHSIHIVHIYIYISYLDVPILATYQYWQLYIYTIYIYIYICITYICWIGHCCNHHYLYVLCTYIYIYTYVHIRVFVGSGVVLLLTLHAGGRGDGSCDRRSRGVAAQGGGRVAAWPCFSTPTVDGCELRLH